MVSLVPDKSLLRSSLLNIILIKQTRHFSSKVVFTSDRARLMTSLYFSGLKVITRAMEIPLVTDAVNQTLAVHSTMSERGGLFGTGTRILWLS